jgi:hypothetical protein
MKTILFVLCLFLAGINSNAQSTNSGSTANLDTNKPAAQTATSAETTDKQVAVLQAQLDFMREYDGRLLTTVYMALGGTFLMWTLINIAAYLTNRQDKKALLKEIQDKTAAETTRLTGEIDTKAKALDDKLASTLAAHKKDLEQIVEAKSKAITDNLSGQIVSVKTQLDANVARLTDDLREADYQFASIEAQNKFEQGIYTTALRGYLEMLNISIERGWTWRVSRDLERIQNLLKKTLDEKSSKPDAELIGGVNVSLAKTPKELSATVSAIRVLIEKIAS